MKTPFTRCLGLAALACAVLAPSVPGPSGPAPGGREAPFLRGMTITCPGYGRIWGSDHMREAVQEVKALGARWVSIHPYAHLERDGRLHVQPASGTGYLGRAVEIAREEGVELFWKPHISYWGSFEWRGEITFGDDEAAWERFFSGYRDFLVDQARFAEGAGVPLLAVGVELEKTTHREAAWRALLAEIRKVYRGEIVYAANWDRLEAVPFWDAVDLIGVQAYFPLSQAESPDERALAAGWAEHLGALEALSRRHGGKRVLLTEIGYNRSRSAAREPWSYRVEGGEEARALRRRLLDVALTRLEGEPWIAGLFWWKWMPGPSPGRSNFSMRDPEARAALQAHWASGPG